MFTDGQPLPDLLKCNVQVNENDKIRIQELPLRCYPKYLETGIPNVEARGYPKTLEREKRNAV